MLEGLSPEALGAGGIVVGLVVFVVLVKVLKAAIKMALFVAALVVIAAVVYVYAGGDLRGAVPTPPTLPSLPPAGALLETLAQQQRGSERQAAPDASQPNAIQELAQDVVQKLPPALLQELARDLPADLTDPEP